MKTLPILCVLSAAAAAEEWKAGPLTLEVHVTRTANLFHVVDNLSNWDQYAHAQYLRAYGEPSGEDEKALRMHAAIRRKKGWGGGLEQTFYTALPLDQALAAGIEAGHVTEAEAERLGAVLRRFQDYADGLLAEEKERLEAFRAKLKEKLPALEEFARAVSRFCHGRAVRVPVYLIANPADHSIGGGYNGGRLTLEVARQRDSYPTFLHELMHAFVNEERELLQAALAKAEGLDYTTLNEGIAYALSPGLFHDGQTLEERVGGDFAGGKPFDNPYVRFNRFGLALRPLLKEALDDEAATLTTFLPRALDAWRVVLELEKARRIQDGRRRDRAQTFSSGPGWRTLGKRVPRLASFNHSADHYARILRRAQPGETFVLMFALDNDDRHVPATYADLLPRPWAEIEAELKKGAVVEARHEARGLKIVVLAAPTVGKLEERIRETDLLAGAEEKRNVEVWAPTPDLETYHVLNRRMHELYGRGVTGRNFATIAKNARRGDVVIVPLVGDQPVPDGFRPYLAREPDHATIEARAVKRGMTLVLLKAPSREELIELMRRTVVLTGLPAHARPPASPRSVFSLGGAYEALNRRMRKLHGKSVVGRDHRPKHWDEIVGRAKKGDLLVILFAPERGPEPVPADYADLLPMPRAEIDARLKRGETVAKEGEARGLRVVLLAAPTRAGLSELVSTTNLLE